MPYPFFKISCEENPFNLEVSVIAMTEGPDAHELYKNTKTFKCNLEQDVISAWEIIKNMIEKSITILEKNDANVNGAEIQG